MERDDTIDTLGRRRFAELLRRLVAGRCTNEEFEDAVDYSDDATRACYFEYAWFLYSDLREHVVRLSREQRRDAARVLLFLYTEQPYEWPGARLRVLDALLSVFFRRSHERLLGQRGFEAEYWPFRNRQSYTTALKNPPLLCGAA